MDGLAEIEEFVVRFEGRGPGTDAERRAAHYLASRLGAIGRESVVEPASVWPNYPLAHLAHALLAIAASLVALTNAYVGVALAAVAVVSAFGDLSGRFYALRRLTGRRASQSVVSPEDGDKPGTLVLVAHYDSGRGGAIFGRPDERRAALAKLIRRPIGAFDPYSASLLLILATAALRAFGIAGIAVSVLQFVPTVVLILSVPVFADIALSPFSPGAGDNASGVATVLRLAERYGETLESFDLWVLLPGAGEGMSLGIGAWLARHKRELDPTRTVFVNVDGVANGTVRFATREGRLVGRRHHSRLIALCAQIADEDAVENRYGARPLRSRDASDAHAAAISGFPAISICCRGRLDDAPNSHRPTDTPDRVDPAALERAFGFCSELIELIDERIGPDLAAGPQRRGARAR